METTYKDDNQFKTTVQFAVEGEPMDGEEFYLRLMVNEHVRKNISGFRQFDALSKFGYVAHSILQVRCNDRANAEKCMSNIHTWIDESEDAEDVNYISSAYLSC